MFSVIYALDFFLVMIFAAAGVSFLIDGEGFKVAWAPLVLAALYVYLVIPKG